MTMGRPFATLVVTATLLCGPSALAYAGPANDSGALLRKADGHRKKGEHQAAARAYAEYYGSQAQAERASETGAYIIDLAASSYVASGDTADLEACRVLLREFLADVAAVHGDAEQPFAADAKSQLAKLDEQLASPPEPEPEPKPEPEPDPEPDPDPEQEPEPEPEREVEPSPNPIVDRTPHGRDKLGIGLVVGGAVAIAGGIGVLVAGSQFLPQARARVRDAEANTTETEVVDSGPFIEQRRRQGNILMGVGGGVIAVGLAATIWGAVRLAKHRKRSRATVSLGGTSVVVHGRF